VQAGHEVVLAGLPSATGPPWRERCKYLALSLIYCISTTQISLYKALFSSNLHEIVGFCIEI
jgi:hypothetical protein